MAVNRIAGDGGAPTRKPPRRNPGSVANGQSSVRAVDSMYDWQAPVAPGNQGSARAMEERLGFTNDRPGDIFASWQASFGNPLANMAAAGLGRRGGGNNGGGGRAGGRGGGGGGAPLSRAQVNQAFAFNPASYDTARQQLAAAFKVNAAPFDSMRSQANAYNPDFGAMQAEGAQRLRGFEDERSQRVAANLQALLGASQQMQAGYGDAMKVALRDLAAQGVNAQPFVDQGGQMLAQATGGMANQAGYMGQLNALGSQGLADSLRTGQTITQGGQAALANNRGQLLNQIGVQQGAAEQAANQALAQQNAALAIQQAQAQQALEQAKLQYLARYGMGA